MTDHEIRLAEALGQCSFLPGHPHKRFVRDMVAIARRSPDKELTPRQREYLDILAWRYRRQIPGSLVPGGKPADLLPKSSPAVERDPRLLIEPPQGSLFLINRLPPVFRREIDL